MREADRRTIQEIGVPGRVLMESAGRGVAGAMEEHVPDLASQSILIICGKGNNGGDGLVLLRTLIGLGYDAHAVVLAPFEEMAPNRSQRNRTGPTRSRPSPRPTSSSMRSWERD